jgi:hypothetical protein
MNLDLAEMDPDLNPVEMNPGLDPMEMKPDLKPGSNPVGRPWMRYRIRQNDADPTGSG